MKICITGANGAVGQAILRNEAALADASFIAAVRSKRAAEQLRAQTGSTGRIALISYDDPASLDAAFSGASAVIHLAGILIETPQSTYETANVDSTRSVVEAAIRCSVAKIVLVSATGADETSSNRYYGTKGEAERLVRTSELNYTVLRAPLLLGPGTAGAAALARHMSHRKIKLIGGGRNLHQPLHVNDLARAAILATQPGTADHLTLDLVGPVSLPDREIVERAATFLGRTIRIGSIPKSFLSLMLAIRKLIGKKGFSRDALEVITADTRIDPLPAERELGIKLTGIEQIIQDSVAQG